MIPIFQLKRQYQDIKKEMDAAIQRVLNAGMFTLGPEVSAFEREFAQYLDSYHAVGVASGTDALTLALKVHNIAAGDEVILPANSYPSAFGVALSGVTIRLVDVADDGTMDVHHLSRVLRKKTKAVIPVHLYGNPADIIGIQNILTQKHSKAILIEDAAQAHGTLIRDGNEWKKAGTIGDIGCYSFYPTKNIGAYGDGGALVTDKTSVDARLRRLRMYGERARYQTEEIAGVTRLDELQAAILRIKLAHIDEWVKRRTEIATAYTDGLSHIGDIRFVAPGEWGKGAYHLFVIRTTQRNALQTYLHDHGIGSNVHYPTPIHLTKSFAHLGYKRGDFPESELQSRQVLSLPIYPELTDSEVAGVVGAIRKFFKQ